MHMWLHNPAITSSYNVGAYDQKDGGEKSFPKNSPDFTAVVTA